MGPMESWLLTRSLRTLDMRMERHSANALKVAQFLEKHPKIEKMYYPGLESSRYKKLTQELFVDGRCGGMLSADIAGGEKGASTFIKERKMVKFVPSLDGVGSSLSYPAKTSHRALTSDEMAMVNMDLQNRGMKNSRIAKKNTDSAGNTLRSLLLRFCKMFMGLIVFSLGITLCIIAGLGQTTSTGTSTALSEALHIRVGTAMELIYALFLLLQLILLGKKFHPMALLQMIPVFLNGALLNFFRYDFVPFQGLSPHTYPERLLFFAAGMPLISLGFTMVKRAGFLNFPPESFCTIVAEKTGIR